MGAMIADTVAAIGRRPQSAAIKRSVREIRLLKI
jgi:hypothetical protein